MTDSVASGPPLETVAHLLGGPRIDDLLSRAAEQAADRTALRSAAEALTFAELNAQATGCAKALRTLLGERGVVALAMTLDPAFAVGFFGIARSGHVAALVNPLLTPDRLVHVLGTAGARAAIVPPELYRRLAPVLDRLPALTQLVLTRRDGLGAEAAGVPTLSELIEGAPHASPAPAYGEMVACLQFTSGTTGAPKAVQLTHRNLLVNAAQTAYMHQLTPDSVLFNYLPTFHLMHLAIGVTVAASHVLHAGDDPVEAMAAAAHARATHVYSLPMRLTRLARDPRLAELELPALRAILSGGSALSVPAAVALAQQFGVPVVQGFGLAETAPSVTLGDLDRPRPGSCGVPVPGTACRIVDPGTGDVVPLGEKGEIQVRGPQLMLGYLGHARGQDVRPGGWFATGDIGLLDADGHLFVTDRIKDVFKCDNWLVSPSQIERVLLRHPSVADCVVFDYPDDLSGAVAYAQVVLAGDVAPEELAREVNGRLPYYEHLKHVETVSRIPRSPTGKVQRQQLRDEVLARIPR
ncbi:class I adenylate-forming enzyme family protein [Amycolatopsis sp. NPDC054798]